LRSAEKKKERRGEEEETKNRGGEEEEEEGERRSRRGNGACKAWTDGGMEGIGVASQGCVCLACASEIE